MKLMFPQNVNLKPSSPSHIIIKLSSQRHRILKEIQENNFSHKMNLHKSVRFFSRNFAGQGIYILSVERKITVDKEYYIQQTYLSKVKAK